MLQGDGGSVVWGGDALIRGGVAVAEGRQAWDLPWGFPGGSGARHRLTPLVRAQQAPSQLLTETSPLSGGYRPPLSPVLRIGCTDGLYGQCRKTEQAHALPQFRAWFTEPPHVSVSRWGQEGAGGELRVSGWRMNTRLKLDMVVSSHGCGLHSWPPCPQQPWVPGPSERWCCGGKVGSAGHLVPKPAQDAQAAGRAAAGPAGPVLCPLGAPWWTLELLVCFSREVSPQC